MKRSSNQLPLDFRPQPVPVAIPVQVSIPVKPTFTQIQQRILYALKHEGRSLIENVASGHVRINTGWIGEPVAPATLEALKRKNAIREFQGDEWGSFRYWIFAN